MDPIDRLLAAEAVRNVKATYWYAMDMKDWEKLAGVFTPDAIFDMRGERAFSLGEDIADLPPVEEAIAQGDTAVTVGAANIAAFIRGVVEKWITVHHGHAAIIDVVAADRATAIWPLFDYIDDGKNALKGYGHYHEEYRREADGQWRISKVLLTRLRSDGTHPWSVMEV